MFRESFFLKLKSSALNNEKKFLTPFGCLSSKAIRRHEDNTEKTDHRLPFAIDADRILYSRAYARYIDKTQVFSLVPNDHITHRALHVQFLSKISRTIGSILGLNLDLIEAIALGHDIGHPPFGHDGERMLSRLSEKYAGKPFYHNIQSIRILEKIEKKGKGLNLTFQSLDGILCHNGEENYAHTAPDKNVSFDKLQTVQSIIEKGGTDYSPSTLEGCLVKICDTISYVGRDFEDAISLKLIKRSQLPEIVVKRLGDTAGKIVFNLVTDVIENSVNKPYISLSEEIAEALFELKRFNYQHIYMNKKIKTEHKKLNKMMEMIFESAFEDLIKKRTNSPIYRDFLNDMEEDYLNSNKPEEIVIDYISTMTDRYFLDIFKEKFVAETLPRYFS